MATNNLIDDIHKFQNLPVKERKWFIEQIFVLAFTLFPNNKSSIEEELEEVFAIGLKAIDALHHLSKEDHLIE